jgi:hypothetical protein
MASMVLRLLLCWAFQMVPPDIVRDNFCGRCVLLWRISLLWKTFFQSNCLALISFWLAYLHVVNYCGVVLSSLPGMADVLTALLGSFLNSSNKTLS